MIKEVIVDLPVTGTLLEDAIYIKCIVENDIEGQMVLLDFLQDQGFKEYLGQDTVENEAWTKLLEYINK